MFIEIWILAAGAVALYLIARRVDEDAAENASRDSEPIDWED
jgi:hypothetical protein